MTCGRTDSPEWRKVCSRLSSHLSFSTDKSYHVGPVRTEDFVQCLWSTLGETRKGKEGRSSSERSEWDRTKLVMSLTGRTDIHSVRDMAERS